MDNRNFKLLLERAERGETEAVLAAVDAEPGLATRARGDGMTLLVQTCRGNNIELARGLLDRGANVHARWGGLDALMQASNCGYLEVCTLLLDRGADPNSRSNSWTALGLAAYSDRLMVCLLLIARGADLRAVMTGNRFGGGERTALQRYGEESSLSPAVLAERRAALSAAFAEGPHPSQVQRRCDERWARRWPFVRVLVCCDFQPTAARRAVLAVLHPPLPPDAVIPRLPCETLAQRRALLRDKIFTHPALWRKVASFL